jgi:hypothetical protein
MSRIPAVNGHTTYTCAFFVRHHIGRIRLVAKSIFSFFQVFFSNFFSTVNIMNVGLCIVIISSTISSCTYSSNVYSDSRNYSPSCPTKLTDPTESFPFLFLLFHRAKCNLLTRISNTLSFCYFNRAFHFSVYLGSSSRFIT